MRIVINHGSNVPDAAVEHYGISVVPATILVDGKAYDTRHEVSHDQLDRWVKEAKEFPHVVGTAAHEFMQAYTEAARTDPEILVVTASPKIVHTFQAASTAARTLQERSQYAHVKISIVDSGLVDIGVGMMAIFAAEAARAELSLRKTAGLVEMLAQRSRWVGHVTTLDNLVRGGRAGFLRAWLADVLEIKPILGFQNGEIKSLGKVRRKDDAIQAITDELAKNGDGCKVWVAIAHGSAPDRAKELLASIEKRFDVAYALTTPLHSTTYLHLARGSVFAALFPIDRLPWDPPTPPPFDVT
ncbi:MAG TPA: DegV family protein [Polyangiaceae bacterium]